MTVSSPLKRANERVIRAAVRWVNVNDDGKVPGLMRLTRAQLELAHAVTALEKARKRALR